MTEQLHFHTLEKEMATHSSVLAWRNAGTEESGGLPSMGWHSQTRLKQLSSSSSSSSTLNFRENKQVAGGHRVKPDSSQICLPGTRV